MRNLWRRRRDSEVEGNQKVARSGCRQCRTVCVALRVSLGSVAARHRARKDKETLAYVAGRVLLVLRGRVPVRPLNLAVRRRRRMDLVIWRVGCLPLDVGMSLVRFRPERRQGIGVGRVDERHEFFAREPAGHLVDGRLLRKS